MFDDTFYDRLFITIKDWRLGDVCVCGGGGGKDKLMCPVFAQWASLSAESGL